MLVDDEVDSSHAPTVMRKEFSLLSAASLAFVLVSPIVALYTIFGAGIALVGPGFWWGLLIAFAGQLLVAVSFGVLASRYPFAGGVYQWSRRLVNSTYGWFAGWVYMGGLISAMAAVPYTGGVFLAVLLGLDPSNVLVVAPLALLIIATMTFVNGYSRGLVKLVTYICIGAEIVGSVGVAVFLLFAGRNQDPGYLLTGLEVVPESPFMMAPLLVAIAISGWAFLGFESASALANEVENPKRDIPKAMVVSLLGVGAVVVFTAFAVILAIPDLPAVLASNDGDPIVTILALSLPQPVMTLILGLFVIAFAATFMGLQASCSRIAWSYSMEGELPAARWISRLRGRTGMPTNSVILTGIASMLVYLAMINDYVNSLLVTFTTLGFMLAFLFPVLGLIISQIRGKWQVDSSPTFLGKFGISCSWMALLWLIIELVNLVWPRAEAQDWFLNAAPFMGLCLILLSGILVKKFSKPTGC